jgi:4-hydroxy-4-methyl-2-oxoglutarate aldolase
LPDIIKEIDLKTFKLMKDNLYTGAIADILDEKGFRNQVMSSVIRPLTPDTKVAGWAKTILSADVYHMPKPGMEYKLEFQAIDSLKKGEVIVWGSNYSEISGFWGELLTTAAIQRGAAGAVGDSNIRDTVKILETGFQLFFKGYRPLDSKGRNDVIAYDCRIECGGVAVFPGDIVFGDIDGVVIIPAGLAVEVINEAYGKVDRENIVREELKKGMSLPEAWEKYHTI